MSEKKITKREMFEAIKNVLTDEKQIEFINHELKLLAKKNSASKKPTATQIANEGIKENIVKILEANGTKMTVTEIQKQLEDDLSNQRISALLRQVISEGKVIRIEEKRKAYFEIV